ncbi:calcium-binding protein [Rhodobacter sp. TJ_12]|uniref:calcium-binding protein n=1 Tax=Rhodobacter sp. TJ_12 TaxID=2029399 RepID=UPI001CC1B41A|nr:calcium-binding protein [Rhodobacter sp. TJ_12]
MAGMAAGMVPLGGGETLEDTEDGAELSDVSESVGAADLIDDAFSDMSSSAAGTAVGENGTVTVLPGAPPVEALPPETAATDESDILWGDLLPDRIDGLAGDDQINGYAGDDTLFGGVGDDTLVGADGADHLLGGEGDDSLIGEDGADTLTGDDGADTLVGGFGADSLLGGVGDDSLLGGADADRLEGGAGNDSLSGNDGADTLTGGLGMDELFGGTGDDVLIGVVADETTGSPDADGLDFLNGGEGADTLIVGAGDWASGGEEGDVFALGDWIAPEEPATIADYDATQDQIVVVYEPGSDVMPKLTLEPAETDGNLWICLDGMRLAEVVDAGTLQLSDLRLVTPAEIRAA